MVCVLCPCMILREFVDVLSVREFQIPEDLCPLPGLSKTIFNMEPGSWRSFHSSVIKCLL